VGLEGVGEALDHAGKDAAVPPFAALRQVVGQRVRGPARHPEPGGGRQLAGQADGQLEVLALVGRRVPRHDLRDPGLGQVPDREQGAPEREPEARRGDGEDDQAQSERAGQGERLPPDLPGRDDDVRADRADVLRDPLAHQFAERGLLLALRRELDVGDQAALEMGVARLDGAREVQVVHPAGQRTRQQPDPEPADRGDAAQQRQDPEPAREGEELVERDLHGERQEDQGGEARDRARHREHPEAESHPIQNVLDGASVTHPTPPQSLTD
jgi:hypothetical protein